MKPTRSRSIFSELFRDFVAIAIIPVLALGCLTIVFAWQISVDNVKKELLSAVQSAGGTLSQQLEGYSNSMQLLAEDSEVVQMLSASQPDEELRIQINQKMYLIIAGQNRLMNIDLVDTDGKILNSTADFSGTPDSVYNYWGILRELQEQKTAILYPGVYGESGSRGLTLAVPVRESEKNIVGYAMLCFSETALLRMVEAGRTELPLSYLLIDRNNYLLADRVIGDDSVRFLPADYRGLIVEGACSTYENSGDQMLLAAAAVGSSSLRLAAVLSVGLVVSSNRSLTVLVILACIGAVLISLFAARKISTRIVRPINVLCGTMQEIESGNPEAVVPELGENEFGRMAKGFNIMLAQLKEQFRVNMERQDCLRIAEYKNLQAQISPHFLYNTLESIKYMARMGMTGDIDTVVSKLGILLRSGMNFKRDMIPLREELRVVDSYVSIQQIRYDGKFSYQADIDEALMTCMVPNLVIQPLVENAIVHGIETKLGHGELRLTGWSENGDIYIEIFDNGTGISADALDSILSTDAPDTPPAGEQNSIGMVNVHRRLKLYFGENYGLSVDSRPNCYTKVTVHMPRQEGSNASYVQSSNR